LMVRITEPGVLRTKALDANSARCRARAMAKLHSLVASNSGIGRPPEWRERTRIAMFDGQRAIICGRIYT